MSRRIILTRSNLQTIIDKLKHDILTRSVDVFFPIGSIYITSKSPENGGDPNNLFPGTHWARIKDAYLCAATSSADMANAAPHGSNTRSASDLPGHTHPTVTTKENSNNGATSSVNYILYKGDESFSVASPFVSDWTSGSWYGTPYNNNNQTKFFQLNIKLPSHNHSVPSNVVAKDTSVATMDIQPKHLYKYGWERTA